MNDTKDNFTSRNKMAYVFVSLAFGLAGLTDLAETYFFKDDMKLEPATLAAVSSFTAMPFIFKPIYGLITDLVPVFGSRRKFYLFICAIGHATCWIMMGTVVTTYIGAMITLFSAYFFLSFATVVGEAIVVEISQKAEGDAVKESVNNIGNFYIIRYVGLLATSYLKGSLLQTMRPQTVFLLATVSSFLILLAAFSFKETETVSEEDQEKGIWGYLVDLFNFVTKIEIFVPLVFIILFVATPSFGTAYFYFLSDVCKFTSVTFAKISLISTIAGILGIYAYKRFFSKTSFFRLVIVCSLVGFIINLTCVVISERINMKYGVSDFSISVFTDSFSSFLGDVMLMPILSIASVNCPENLEGTVFSFYASSINLGGNLSNLSGSFVTNMFGVTSKHFENLSALIISTNLMSLVPLFLLFFIKEEYFQKKEYTELPTSDVSNKA